MPRQLRIEYEGAIYHVMNRGDRREDIVHGPSDRELFVATLEEAAVRSAWEVHAWVLMRNHFHLGVETPLGNLVDGMKWFLGAYTIRFNARHRLRGHLFAGHYKSLLVDHRDPHYLRTVCDYIHLNLSRAGLLAAETSLAAYPWSSCVQYLRKPAERPEWLRMDRVLGEHGIRRDDTRGRLEFARRMENLRAAESPGTDYKAIRQGWRFGGEDFVAEMLEKIAANDGGSQTRTEQAESMEQRARRLIADGLREAGWSPARLAKERKGHPIKVRLARQVRRETTMTLQWIAKNLSMGSWTYVSNLLRSAATPSKKCQK